MKLRKFDDADWQIFAGATGSPLIAELDNYVVIVDSYGLTINRYTDNSGINQGLYVDFVTIEMLPSQAELLVTMMIPCCERFDKLIDDAQPMVYTELY